jgi:hypothetical protein
MIVLQGVSNALIIILCYECYSIRDNCPGDKELLQLLEEAYMKNQTELINESFAAVSSNACTYIWHCCHIHCTTCVIVAQACWIVAVIWV